VDTINVSVVILGGLASLVGVILGIRSLLAAWRKRTKSQLDQRAALEDNTAGLKEVRDSLEHLSAVVSSLSEKVDMAGWTLNNHEGRVQSLESRFR
jgi:hypothetical protein